MTAKSRFGLPLPEMTGADFGLALFSIEAKYNEVAAFYGSDRRTGHRWTKGKPSTPVARDIQLMLALGLTLADAKFLIEAGVDEAGGGNLPKPALDLKALVASMRQARGDRHEQHTGSAGGASASLGAALTAA